MIAKADIRRVQEWMGHADIQTTMKYLHYESRAEDAELVTRAFAPASGDGGTNRSEPLDATNAFTPTEEPPAPGRGAEPNRDGRP
jgi:hypothetical protein